jgi:hypothetical protein
VVVSGQPAAPTITVVLTDHHFRLSAPVEGGALRWQIRNEGTEPHQAMVIRLPEGVSEYGQRAWFEHGHVPPPLRDARGRRAALRARDDLPLRDRMTVRGRT